MSTMAAPQEYYEDEAPTREEAPASTLRAAAEKLLGVKEAAIVPADSISGRALVAVIAIMTFLAALTLGAVVLVRGAAAEWQGQVAREVTIQIRPAAGRDVEAEGARATEILRGAPGVAAVRPMVPEGTARLHDPWLGTGLSLDELPVPRMIVVTVAPGGAPALDALRKTLAERVAGASLDDHRGWVERMRAV